MADDYGYFGHGDEGYAHYVAESGDDKVGKGRSGNGGGNNGNNTGCFIAFAIIIILLFILGNGN